jgi:hypothetical protein
MNQALYAHMNNKRKMKKKKEYLYYAKAAFVRNQNNPSGQISLNWLWAGVMNQLNLVKISQIYYFLLHYSILLLRKYNSKMLIFASINFIHVKY